MTCTPLGNSLFLPFQMDSWNANTPWTSASRLLLIFWRLNTENIWQVFPVESKVSIEDTFKWNSSEPKTLLIWRLQKSCRFAADWHWWCIDCLFDTRNVPGKASVVGVRFSLVQVLNKELGRETCDCCFHQFYRSGVKDLFWGNKFLHLLHQ